VAALMPPKKTSKGVRTMPQESQHTQNQNQQSGSGQRGDPSKGGQSQGQENNPGNFANDREKASEAGRKGGQS
jgi:general stress protein YciG